MRFSILCLGFLGSLPFFSLRLQASGFHNDSIEVGSRSRSYRLFVPSNLPNPVPVVFVFHGTETPGHGIDSIIRISRFEEIGQVHHALIIFPEAYEVPGQSLPECGRVRTNLEIFLGSSEDPTMPGIA